MQSVEGDALLVGGLAAGRIGELALEHRVALHELAPQGASLEEVFLELTAETREEVAAR